uniref:Uncharacterized protein n=1 Tax=Heterorhabditis bacteriophora TaxID=37862 RepID=A0A1I7X251_HETBA
MLTASELLKQALNKNLKTKTKKEKTREEQKEKKENKYYKQLYATKFSDICGDFSGIWNCVVNLSGKSLNLQTLTELTNKADFK